MGGVAKTMNKGFESTKKVLSGKGNARDIFSAMTGMSSPDHGLPPDESAFNFDPEQAKADKLAIEGLGTQQYNEMEGFNQEDMAAREASRAKLADLLTQRARDTFARTLPDIAENSQAAHLFDTTGYGQEVARQQAALGQDIASKLGEVGLNDINRSSDVRYEATKARQGLGSSALSRNFSLQDFAKQATVAKAIGAQSAPMVGNGKGGAVSGGAAGAGAGAPFGPWAAALGGIGGAVLGSQANKPQKKGK